MLDSIDKARERARDLITYADGLEDGGYPDLRLPSRIRNTARDVLDLTADLEAARSALDAMRGNYDRCLTVLGQRGYDRATSHHE